MAASTHRLLTLGALDLRSPDGSELVAVLAQPRRVALLVYLALAIPRGPQRRDRLLALFWPDQDDAHARNALSQAVHFLRRSIGADALTSRTAEELALEPAAVWCDAVAFDEAMGKRNSLDAVELYRGELLPGFHVAGVSSEYTAWLDSMRAAYARRYASALHAVAEEREAAGDYASALDWRRRLAAQDPLDSAAALKFMQALAAAGDATSAIRHARVHEVLLRSELGASPDARIVAFANSLQERPTPPAAAARKATAAAFSTDSRRPADASNPASATSMPAAPGAPILSARAEAAAPPAPPATTASTRRLPPAAIAGLGVALAGALGIFSFVRGREPALTPNCVAVVPFASYTGSRADDDVVDAFTDALITELARYPQLSVISRSSVTRYKGANISPPEISRALRCGTTVEGSLSRDGDQILVNAQLIDAPRDRHLWAERYFRPAAELAGLERDIAQAVAVQLGAASRPADPARAGADPPPSRAMDPITYGIYLRGRDATLSRDPTGLRHAIALFKQALVRDSSFALGWAGLSDAYRLAGGFGYMPETFVYDSAPAAARRALALDDRLSEAHSSIGAVLTDAADWTNAEAEFRRAIELEPGNAVAHQWYAAMLITVDRKQDALREIRRALELDPLSQSVRGLDNMIESYEGIRRAGGLRGVGRAPLRTGLVDPNHPGTRAARAVNFARNGRCPQALAESDTALMLAPGAATILIGRAGVDLICNDRRAAMAIVARVKSHPDVYLSGVYMAEFYVATGDHDSAFAWLGRTHYGMGNRMELRMSPLLQPLRSDRRWPALLQREHMR